MSRGRRAPVRSYGVTGWGRAFLDAVEGGAEHRQVTGARRYFRDRHVDALSITRGVVTASVRGSQLDPFDVRLEMRTVDAETVVGLLVSQGATDDLLDLARGAQPPTLGGFVAPTESADVVSDCTCPDERPRCTHVLAVAFEVAAEIDRHPATLLTVMGTDLPELLAAASGDGASGDGASGDGASGDGVVPAGSTGSDGEDRAPFGDDPFGDRLVAPPVPSFPAVDPLDDLDPTTLRHALRATGVATTEVTEALDELAAVYEVLTRRR
ncbi:SWIM zinc finger family protein [Gordonia shandongensis]|uniref:SWIM zinc finger family protein n=1 Tax=Gordonia shandongensis TaxID=376351 RepID=UPI0003FD599B|nr:SWIM zinc finger family protein [Gordonia shandongensis]